VAKGETTACRKKATHPRELYTWRVRSCSRGLQHPRGQGWDRRMTNRPRRIHAPVRRNSTATASSASSVSLVSVVVIMMRDRFGNLDPAPWNPKNSRLLGWRTNERGRTSRIRLLDRPRRCIDRNDSGISSNSDPESRGKRAPLITRITWPGEPSRTCPS